MQKNGSQEKESIPSGHELFSGSTTENVEEKYPVRWAVGLLHPQATAQEVLTAVLNEVGSENINSNVCPIFHHPRLGTHAFVFAKETADLEEKAIMLRGVLSLFYRKDLLVENTSMFKTMTKKLSQPTTLPCFSAVMEKAEQGHAGQLAIDIGQPEEVDSKPALQLQDSQKSMTRQSADLVQEKIHATYGDLVHPWHGDPWNQYPNIAIKDQISRRVSPVDGNPHMALTTSQPQQADCLTNGCNQV